MWFYVFHGPCGNSELILRFCKIYNQEKQVYCQRLHGGPWIQKVWKPPPRSMDGLFRLDMAPFFTSFYVMQFSGWDFSVPVVPLQTENCTDSDSSSSKHGKDRENKRELGPSVRKGKITLSLFSDCSNHKQLLKHILEHVKNPNLSLLPSPGLL